MPITKKIKPNANANKSENKTAQNNIEVLNRQFYKDIFTIVFNSRLVIEKSYFSALEEAGSTA